MAEITEEIKNRIDIVEFLSGYITLKRAGRNHKAICPFHSEKSPSFMVSSEKQIWHCFGCGEGGDIFGFLMKIEGLGFVEALEQLANRANVVLPREHQNPEKKKRKTDFYKINELSCQIFQKIMFETEWGKEALNYYQKRGLSPETISRFRLGLSSKTPNFVSKLLLEKGYNEKALIEAGISMPSAGNRITDRFTMRLMFPIADVSGKVVGFAARVFDNTLPKYINTADSPIYNKSHVLYGLSEAKQAIRELGYVLIVEGNMDVLACYNAEIKNAVASSGTAITISQLNLIKRFTPNIKFAFDADGAGIAATQRAVKTALENDFNVEVVKIPAGKDPADAIKESIKEFKEAISASVPAIQYFIDELIKKNDLKTAHGKKVFVQEITRIINLLSSQTEKRHWITAVAKMVEVPEDDLIRFGKFINSSTDNDGNLGQGMKIISKKVIEENLLGLTFMFPKFAGFVVNNLKVDELTDENREVFISLLAFKKKKFTSKSYFKEFPELASRAKYLILNSEQQYEEMSEDKAGDEIVFMTRRVKNGANKEKIITLLEKIKEAEKMNDNVLKNKLLKDYNQILIKDEVI